MKDRALVLMDEAAAVYLATAESGRPRVRAMVNLRRQDSYPKAAAFCRGQGFTVYFSTSLASGKVREIRANPAVAVYYCDPEKFHGVMLAGEMEILTSPDLKETLWSEDWRIYWPTGPGDSDYAVLRMQPTRAEGWRGTAPFHFEL